MAPSAADDFLRRCRHVVLGVRGDDGYPSAAVALVRYETGRCELTLRTDDHVAQALRTPVEICWVADEWPSYDEIKGVIAHGVAVAPPSPVDVATVQVNVDVARMTTFDFGSRAD